MKNYALVLALTFASATSALANCEIHNELDRDSWDCAASSVQTCLNNGSNCEGRDGRNKSVLTIKNIDEGVGNVLFTLTRAQDGTQNIVAYSDNLHEVILNAQGLPADANIGTILDTVYENSENLPWGCQWK